MQVQTEAAIAAADAVFFLIDARTGPTPVDRAFATSAQIRQARHPDRQQE